jgi:N-acyl-D-amino-acid deacylase
MHDLVIRGATIVDGSGEKPFAGDVAVKDGVIVEVGEVAGSGAEEIDASGAILTPGFVDIGTQVPHGAVRGAQPNAGA